MANTLLDAQTNISNDTLREIVSESAFIGESATGPVYTHATYGTLVAAFSTGLVRPQTARFLLQKTIRSQMMKMS